eukprot:gene24558-10169_t
MRTLAVKAQDLGDYGIKCLASLRNQFANNGPMLKTFYEVVLLWRFGGASVPGGLQGFVAAEENVLDEAELRAPEFKETAPLEHPPNHAPPSCQVVAAEETVVAEEKVLGEAKLSAPEFKETAPLNHPPNHAPPSCQVVAAEETFVAAEEKVLDEAELTMSEEERAAHIQLMYNRMLSTPHEGEDGHSCQSCAAHMSQQPSATGSMLTEEGQLKFFSGQADATHHAVAQVTDTAPSADSGMSRS